MRTAALMTLLALICAGAPAQRPNIVLLMADDLGYADLGCQGHQHLHTPHLDRMAAEGIRFRRFHAAAPVCSPTRASVLTGKHPLRCGVPSANSGHLREDELTLQQVLAEQGYRCGFFGKWHLGTMTKTVKDSNRGGSPKGAGHFAPPWLRGFERCFATEAKVPTLDPMKHPKTGKAYGTHYWNEAGEIVRDDLDGDDSNLIVDRALPFVAKCAKAKQPFFTIIWYHAPHLPIVASEADRKRYAQFDETTQHYYGCITALDRSVGRLRQTLEELGIADHTILWFCSDNGPEGRAGKAPGSAGPLRGRKRSLFEGGTRVPSLLVWPKRFGTARVTDTLAHTADILPTVAGWLGLELPPDPQRDGVDLSQHLAAAALGKARPRKHPIGFEFRRHACWTDDRYKLVAHLGKAARGTTAPIERVQLFDLVEDPGERNDIAAGQAARVSTMRKALEEWRGSLRR